MTDIVWCFPAFGGLGDCAAALRRTAEDAGAPTVVMAESPHDRARGMIAGAALATGAEWLLWIDSDTVAEYTQAVGLVATAQAHGFDLLTGVYVCRHLAAQGKLAFNFSPEIGGDFTMGPGGGPFPILSCGFGFVATHRRLFDMVDAPECTYGKAWFLPLVHGGHHLGEDRSFGVRAKAAGAQMYVDTRVLVGHEGTKVWRPEDFR